MSSFSLAGVLTGSKLAVADRCLTSVATPPRRNNLFLPTCKPNSRLSTIRRTWIAYSFPSQLWGTRGEEFDPGAGGWSYGRGTDAGEVCSNAHHSNKLPFLFELVDLGFHHSVPRFPTIMVINLISSLHLNFWQFCAFVLVLFTKSISKLIILHGITQCLSAKALITPYKQVSMAFISFPP